MKHWKRMLAVLLAVLLCMQVLPLTLFAEEAAAKRSETGKTCNTQTINQGQAASRFAFQPVDSPNTSGTRSAVTQPSIDASEATVWLGELADVVIVKNDGDFTFDSLLLDGAALEPGTDYTVTATAVAIKTEFLETLGTGTFVFTLHYTGTAGDEDEYTPYDPIFTLKLWELCTPTLIARGYWGSNVTYGCTVEWRSGDEVLEAPIAVEPGTTLSYTVTPTDRLANNGVLYYEGVSGEVTLTEPEQTVEVNLIQLGRITLTVKNQDGDPIPDTTDASYQIAWYTLDGEDYTQIGEGTASPTVPLGSTLYCDVTMTGQNAVIYASAEKYAFPINYYGNDSETLTFTTEETASALLTVTGFEGRDITRSTTVVWKDSRGNELDYPFTVPAGSVVRYTATPNKSLMIGGVQYYTAVSGQVQLLSENQPVNLTLGQKGTVTIKLVDKKTGEEIPMDGDDGWSVQWYHNGYRDGSGDTSRMRDTGDEISCYLSLRGKTSANYYNPGNVYYTVGFGNRTEIIDANIRVPELDFYTFERRVSQSGYLDVNRTDNGYTFDFVSLNGEELVLDRDYVDTGYRVAFKAEYLASLGCGTHVFTVHYKETTAEDNYDTQLTVNLTPGDLNEVVFQSRANTLSFPTFYYSGEPKTLNPLLYVGSWANDQRMGMLREGVDYEIAYENNINATTADNLAKAIFTGLGDYEGSTMVKEFKIKPCEINTGYADFEVVPNWDWPYLYDGTPKDMTDVSVYSRGKLLTEGVDYEISYSTWNDMPETVSSRIGSPTETVEVPIVIQGIGNYTSQWKSQSDYGTRVQYRIMPHVEESVGGTLVLNPGSDHPIPWTWQLDPDGLLTVSGEGEMPEFSARYWLGGDDPDHYYFYGWRNGYSDYIKRAVVTGNVTRIESSAFDGCTNLVEAILPESVEVIGGSAFGNCRSLKTVHAPDSIRLPESLHTVESAMYYGCFGINTYNLELHLPDNITSYGLNSMPSSNKLYCRYGTTTHETLKAMGATGKHIVEGWDNYVLEYQDNYNLGGTYTVYGYVGHGGEERLPDFIDSITHYDIFGQKATLVTKLTIPGSIRVLNGDAFRFLDNCTEIVIEPGAMESLIQGLLYYHPETVLTIPDTVTTMPGGDFSGAYYGTTLIVGEGSAALEWAIEKGYYPDDGSGYGKLYRVVKNVQPYVTPLTATVPSDTQEDVTITRNDGAFTFDSLLCDSIPLRVAEDYSVDGQTVTIKASFIQTLEIGTHELTLHYTGLAVDAGNVAANDPIFKLTVVSRCRPVLTVLDKDGQDVTARCEVVWKSGSTVLEEPFSVAEGAAITYTVTPKDDLMVDGVQYYKAVTGEVRLTEAEQAVEVSLGQLGTCTVTPSFEGAPIPEGWTVRWFEKTGTGYRALGTGDTSPLAEVGTTLYYDVVLSGENALDYQNSMKNPVLTVFGNTDVDAPLSASLSQYTIRFYLNDGVESEPGSCAEQSIRRNQALILPAAPTRHGWIFTGWSCNYDGSIRQPGDSVTVKQDMYFYACWTERTPLTVAFDVGDIAGSVSLVGVNDRGQEIPIWGVNQSLWTPEPITLQNHYRNDNTLVSLVLYGKVDGVRTELARYDDDNNDLYDTEGTVTLTKVGDWTPITGIAADGMTPGVDYYASDYVYNDPGLGRGTGLYLPILTDGSVPYYVRFSGHPGSENYVNHDWTKVYALTLTDGVLHAAVDAIAPETWTGRVVFGSSQVPVPNATVTLSQYAYGLSRGYSAVTDESGSFTIDGFPDVATTVTVNWGGKQACSKYYNALSDALFLPIRQAVVSLRVGFDAVYDEALRERIAAAVDYYGPAELKLFESGSETAAYRTSVGVIASGTLAVSGLSSLDAVSWSLTGKCTEPLSGSLRFTDGHAELEAVQKLHAAALVRLTANVISGSVKLAWFDESGSFLAVSPQGAYLNGNPRDVLALCPMEDGGSFTVALMPESATYGLTEQDTLETMPESWIYRTWAVSLTRNEIKELEAFNVEAVASENARYATKPASTLNASQDSFASTDDLIRFTGSIGLDANMKNGKLTKLVMQTSLGSDDQAGSVKVEYVVIGGVVYGPEQIALGHGQRTLTLNEPLDLPCEYTIYAKPNYPNRDMVLTLQMSGSYIYGAGHEVRLYNEPVGTVTVSRPGAHIYSLSSYVCGDTVTIQGTALRDEEVSIYDGDAIIGTAKADTYGSWRATVPLEGTGAYMTEHVLTAETASGVVSDELTLLHDPNGPELKRFYISFGSAESPTIVEPWSSYTTTTSGQLTNLTFRAAFENREMLDVMADGAQVVFKYYLTDGTIGYLNASYDEAEDVYLAAFPGRTSSSLARAEVLYSPIVHAAVIGDDYSLTDAWHAPITFTLSDAELSDYNNYAETVLTDTGLESDSYDIDFTGGDAVLNGKLPEGSTLADFTAAADAMAEYDLHIGGVGVTYTGAPQSTLQWLGEAANTWLNRHPENANAGVFTRVLTLPDCESFEQELAALTPYAILSSGAALSYDGGEASLDVLALTDATVQDGTLYGSYFITVQTVADDAKGLFTLTVNFYLTSEFAGFTESLQAGVETAEALSGRSDTRGAAGTRDLEIRQLPDWYSWAWDSADKLSGDSSAALGFINGGCDMAKVFPNFSKFAGQASGAFALINQFTSTINYMVASDDTAKKQGDRIENMKNSSCYKKAMQWLYEQGMDDENFDDGGLYQDQCNLIDAMRDADFSGDITGYEKAAFYVNSACNAVAMYAALGGPVSWAAGLGVTGFGYLFGKVTSSWAEQEKEARTFLYRRFMRNCAEMLAMYSKAHPNDPDCNKFHKTEDNQAPVVFEPVHDPSGVVFEGVIENPIEGATATLYYAVDHDGNLVQEDLASTAYQLLPADEVRSLIPTSATQTTDANGRYAWYVPEGLWYVAVSCDGYESGSSNDDTAATVYAAGKNLLPVLPVQLNVNIPLVDRTAPTVTDIRYTTDGVYITFSKYMDERLLLRASSYELSVRKGGEGEPVYLDFDVLSMEQGHVPDNLPNAGTTYTRTVLLQAEGLEPGDVLHCTVSGALKSYAGTTLGGAFEASGVVEGITKLEAPVLYVGGAPVTEETTYVSRGAALELRLPESAAEIASAKLVYSTDGGESWKTCTDLLSLTNNVDFLVKAEAIGYEASEIVAASFVLTQSTSFYLAGSVVTSTGVSADGETLTLTGPDGYSKTVTVVQDGFAFFDLVPGSYTLSYEGSAHYAAASATVEITDNNVLLPFELTAVPCDYELIGWTWTGLTHAEACFQCALDEAHTLTLPATVTCERIEPSCLSAGSLIYTATVELDGETYTDTKTETFGEPTGHDWNDPTYVWAEDNSSVTATRICRNDETHVETETVSTTVETVAASCTAEGNRLFTATFENPAFETQTKTVVIDPLSHTPGEPVKENETAPTCTEAGGYDTVLYCTVCNAEISREHTELPAIGHDWNEPIYEWAEDYAACTATRVCKNDAAHTEAETVNTTSEVTKPATYEEEGEIVYTATFENEAFTTQTRTVATPKLDGPKPFEPCNGGDDCPGNVFTDMPAKGHWAHDAIDWAIVNNITAGTSATTFSPNAGCTRSQVVTFLWRAAGEPEPTANNNPFTDVKEGTFYYKAVLWAVENKVTAGTSATTFSPDAVCTRGQIVTFLWRYEGEPTGSNSDNPFTDVKAGAYYEKAVLWAAETGVTEGTSATTFSPDNTCTRAQVVTFLYRDLAN